MLKKWGGGKSGMNFLGICLESGFIFEFTSPSGTEDCAL
jgi:hypothetical protein